MARLDIYSRASAQKAKMSRVVTLPGGEFYAGGKVFKSRSEAEAAAAKFSTD
jgi:hypothetical protein